MLLGMLYSGVQAKEEAQKLMSDLPTGTVTFLFTDIEGSTQLWEKSPRGMQIALTRHDAVLWEAIEGHGGSVFKTVGDAFCAVFPTALGALESALARPEGSLLGSVGGGDQCPQGADGAAHRNHP